MERIRIELSDVQNEQMRQAAIHGDRVALSFGQFWHGGYYVALEIIPAREVERTRELRAALTSEDTVEQHRLAGVEVAA